MIGQRAEAGVEEKFDIVGRYRAEGDAPGLCFHFEKWFQPEQAAQSRCGRAIDAARPAARRTASATSCAPTEGRTRRAAQRRGCSSPLAPRDQAVEAGGVDATMELAVENERRRTGAIPEAEDRLQRVATVGRGLMEIDAQPALDVRGEAIRAHALARLGTADADHMPARRRLPEIMVKGDDAVHLGAAEVERFGDQRNGGGIDGAEIPEGVGRRRRAIHTLGYERARRP